MKSLVIILLIGICLNIVAVAYAGEITSAISINTMSNKNTKVSFNLPKYEITAHIVNEINQEFHYIEIEEGLSAPEKGLPELPIFSASIAIPCNSTIWVESVTLGKTTILEDMRINPTQDYENSARLYDYDASFYESKDNSIVYPESIYSISDINIIRDFQYITLYINPMRYYPSSNQLEVIEQIEININHISSAPQPIYHQKQKLSRAFEPLYENLLANYQQIRLLNPEYQEPSLLIIYGNGVDQSALNQLISWKQQRGMLVNHVQANAAGAGTSTSAIKQYIQNAYNTWDNPPEFLFLIGIPSGSSSTPYYLPSNSANSGNFTDYPYTHLSGNDLIGDIFVGRLTPTSHLQFQKQVEKIIRYEKYPLFAGDTWLQRSYLVADSYQSGISTIIVSRYIKSVIQDLDPTHTFIEQYGWNPTPQSMYSNFNSGITNFSFRGLGGMNYIDPTVSNINNPDKLPFCIWVTCNTGGMNNSLIDTITRLTPGSGARIGAIGAMGMANNGTHTAWNNALSGAVYHGLYPAKMATLGQANLYARAYVVQGYGSPSLISTANNFASWLNLVGDPTVNVYKKKPTAIITELPSTIATGTQGKRFEIIDEFGDPVRDAWITLSKTNNNEIVYLTKAITDASGVGYLTIDPDIEGILELVVSKADYITKIQNVTTNVGAEVAVRDYLINDSEGNNNGEINPGETINLTLNIQNYHEIPVENLSATLTTESNLITIINDTVDLGTIPAQGIQNYYDAFTFVVSPLFADNALIPLTITITDGNDTWISYLTLLVKGLNLNILSTHPSEVPIDNITNVYFTFKNNGTYIGYDLQAKLYSKSPFLTIIDSTTYLGDVIQGQTINNASDPFSIYVLPTIFPGLSLNAELYIYNILGFEEFIPLKITAGTKQATDPTGPCDYGYVIYGSNDIDYEEAPEYNWKSIRTIGQNTGIVDASATTEEGGASINLPFTASYYGAEYNQIFICSNGWFVFGTTTQKDFRNLPLPGPIAPKAMVAPYWTDLVVGGSYGGGIYTYYDTEDNAFIIQWDRLKWVTGYGGYGNNAYIMVSSDSVTFQAIIYDPEYNSTTSNDSPIKFQYHRWRPGSQGTPDHPLNYVTVGFQDHSELRGLTYVYDNRYTPGSAPISDGMALLITQPYFLNDGPNIFISQIVLHDENKNNVIEAGELLDIGVVLMNTGTQLAPDVRTTLTFDSPYIEVINGSARYGDLEVLETKSNPDYFTAIISSDTPDNYRIIGSLRIISVSEDLEPFEWTRQIEFTVQNPTLTYRSYLINDYNGNNNGIVEAGETIMLVVNIANSSDLAVYNAEANILTNNQNITLIKSSDTISIMESNTHYQFVFEIIIGNEITEISSIPIQLSIVSQNAPPISRILNMGVNQGQTIIDNYCDTLLPSGWTIQSIPSNWALSQTNNAGGIEPEIKFTGSIVTTTSRYISPPIDTRDMSAVALTFKHAAIIGLQNVLALKIGTRQLNAPQWTEVWTLSFNDSFNETIVNININENLGTQYFQFCFILEGYMIGVQNWFLDDIVLSTNLGNTTIYSGNVSILNNYLNNDLSNVTINAGNYSTNAKDDGSYSLYLLPNLYPSISIKNEFLVGNYYLNQDILPGQLFEDMDFTLYYKIPAYNFRSKIDENQNLELDWDHLYDYETDILNFSHFILYKQENSMLFFELTTIDEPDSFDLEYDRYIYKYTEAELDPNSRYRYYVQAVYESGKSEISPIKYIDPNDIHEDDDIPWEEDDDVEDNEDIDSHLSFKLYQNYPNPFNPSTNINFSIPETSKVSIKIYNIKGQLVKTLFNDYLTKGNHTLQWNGDNDLSQKVSSGIYFIKLSDEKQSIVKKSLLLK